MICRDVVAKTPERVAGLLDAATTAQIDWHCSGCESCRTVAERETREERALRSAFTSLHALEGPAIDVRGAVAGAIVAARKPRARRLAPVAVAAILAMVILPILFAAVPLTWTGLRAVASGGEGMLGGLGALFEAGFGAALAVLAAVWNLIEPILRVDALRQTLVGSATLLTASGLALMTGWIAHVLYREIRQRPWLQDVRTAR